MGLASFPGKEGPKAIRGGIKIEKVLSLIKTLLTAGYGICSARGSRTCSAVSSRTT